MQYSLKSLFLATTGVAVLFAIACTLPDLISISVMMYITLILPGATIALIVYGRGYVQAFAIGCAVSPVGPAILSTPYLIAAALSTSGADTDRDTFLYMKLGILGYHFINISCGIVAVIARWCVLRAKSTGTTKPKVLDELIVEQISSAADEPYALIHGRVGLSENGSVDLERENLLEIPKDTAH